ncbi:hypothetical protein GCM10028791_00660 [Echinicola sediminis]
MWSHFSLAQESLFLKYEVRGEKVRKGAESFAQPGEADEFLDFLVKDLQKQGYLMAGIAHKDTVGDSIKAVLMTGDRFEWLELSGGNVPKRLQDKIGFSPGEYSRAPFSHQEVLKVFEGLLTEMENNGYPFAAVSLDSIAQRERAISASLHLVHGPQITFDSLKVLGDSKMNPDYLSKYLGISRGELFSQKKVNAASGKLTRLRTVKLVSSPRISFQNSEATVYLVLEDRKVNAIDGIIGFLPNESERNKVLVTGQFDLELYNVSGRGRDYTLHWQRLSQYTQNLNLSAEEPMVLGSSIDVKASFSLLKEDTTFLNRDFSLSFLHQLGPTVDMGFFSSWRSGDLLSVPQTESRTLPDVLDYRYHNYGATMSVFLLDDAYLPKRGQRAIIEVGLGNKKILHNSAIEEDLYDGVDKESIQYHSKLILENFWTWGRNISALIRANAGIIEGGNLLRNDMFRLGGLKSIRGFNENFFFANRYVYTNFEPRFYFEDHSYFLAFVDWAWLEQRASLGRAGKDQALSLGGGLSLDTGNGAFQLVFGVGKSNEQQMGVNYAKVHFGYLGRF